MVAKYSVVNYILLINLNMMFEYEDWGYKFWFVIIFDFFKYINFIINSIKKHHFIEKKIDRIILKNNLKSHVKDKFLKLFKFFIECLVSAKVSG